MAKAVAPLPQSLRRLRVNRDSVRSWKIILDRMTVVNRKRIAQRLQIDILSEHHGSLRKPYLKSAVPDTGQSTQGLLIGRFEVFWPRSNVPIFVGNINNHGHIGQTTERLPDMALCIRHFAKAEGK
ncbi:MAG: hypothetical protein VX739_14955 [Planctomycetota bacterium]|nr:hypothetical protein [Planctomycetota bacterium]